MNPPVRYESIQEPFDEEERLLMNPETWDWESMEEGAPVPNAGAILEIVFTREEIARVEPVAHTEGLTFHELIKRAALARIPRGVSR